MVEHQGEHGSAALADADLVVAKTLELELVVLFRHVRVVRCGRGRCGPPLGSSSIGDRAAVLVRNLHLPVLVQENDDDALHLSNSVKVTALDVDRT